MAAEITIYTRDDCQPCKMTKKFLERKGLPYDEENVDHNPAARARLKELGYTSTPVIMTSYGDEWTGLRPDLLHAYTARAKAES